MIAKHPCPWLDLRLCSARGFSEIWAEIEPLLALQDASRRQPVIDAILRDFPSVTLETGESFYRLRKSPSNPASPDEYDVHLIQAKGVLIQPAFL